jgi:K+-sensing histidine kinase KdpD
MNFINKENSGLSFFILFFKEIHFEKELNLESITAESRLMEQVIQNLADNACKYGGDKVQIKISSYENKYD